MLKPILIAAALSTFGAATVYAQAAPPPAAPTMRDAGAPAYTADTRKMIGRNVKGPNDETIGDIEAIYLDKDGKVDSVIIGVGGFLGIGERDVRIAWRDLTVTQNGERITTAMTKDQLKALPAYKYGDTGYRGQVFTDTGIYRDGTAAGRTVERPAGTTQPPAASVANKPTKDFNADGNISTDAILGASVRNAANESVGDVKDVYVDTQGRIQTIVVSVGGFLGMGTKHVAVKWADLEMRRDGDKLILLSNWTKDALKAMPEYTYERQEAVRR